MDRTAVFVDAAYLFAAGSMLITGAETPSPRGATELDPDAVVEALSQFATLVTGLPLLRIYWYDGTSIGPTRQHTRLASHPNIKVRLGIVNLRGQQKGVDSLIVTDLINLARNHAMADAVLVSGDEDTRVGIQQAQEFGVRVHLLGIKVVASKGGHNQSLYLIQEADTSSEWGKADVEGFLKPLTLFAAPDRGAMPLDSNDIEFLNQTIIRQLSKGDLEAINATGRLSEALNYAFFSAASKFLLTGKSDKFSSDERASLREKFIAACRVQHAALPNTPQSLTDQITLLESQREAAIKAYDIDEANRLEDEIDKLTGELPKEIA